jgi:hypothetical protein
MAAFLSFEETQTGPWEKLFDLLEAAIAEEELESDKSNSHG